MQTPVSLFVWFITTFIRCKFIDNKVDRGKDSYSIFSIWTIREVACAVVISNAYNSSDN